MATPTDRVGEPNENSHKDEWVAGPDTILELAMVYERHDGRNVALPSAAILTVNDKGLVADWRIFMDPAPLYAE